MSSKNVVPLYVLTIGAFPLTGEYISAYMIPIIIGQFPPVFWQFQYISLWYVFYTFITRCGAPQLYFGSALKLTTRNCFYSTFGTVSRIPLRRLMPKVSFCDLSPEVEVTKIILMKVLKVLVFPTAERVDGISLPFYLCLYLNLYFLLCCFIVYKWNVLCVLK